jgi:hypothetical protein
MKGAVKWVDSIKAVRTRPSIVETAGVAVAIIKQAFSPVTILVRVTAMEQVLDRLWHKVTSKPRHFKAVIQMLVECTMQQSA